MNSLLTNTSTNYYHLGHVSRLHYVVYTLSVVSSTKQDQQILEAELMLRFDHPKIICTYYNKELWIFGINGDGDLARYRPSSKYNLVEKHTDSVEPHKIFNNSLINLTFLKAVKKLVNHNLTINGCFLPFGNYGLSLVADDFGVSNEIVLIDPLLTINGDFLLNMSRKSLQLERLQLSETDTHFAIYLLPSGIKCHFANNNNIQDSVSERPKNFKNLLLTLKLSTGIKLDEDTIRWVKLIPNLNHLNNKTPAISDYLLNGTNKKFIIWPLNLCYIQRGVELVRKSHEHTPLCDNFDLVNEFIDFKLKQNEKMSNVNTPITISNTPKPISQFNTPDFNLTLNNQEEGKKWLDLNEELFGDKDEVKDEDFNFFDDMMDKEPVDGANSESEEAENPIVTMPESSQNQEQPDNEVSSVMAMSPAAATPRPKTPFDIPVDEMTIKPTPSSYIDPLYSDPGAPLPMSSPVITSRNQSIYSPLNFNPIIKTNIDEKYINGGKFFVNVDKEETGFINKHTEDKEDDMDESDTDSEESDEDEEEEEKDVSNSSGGNLFETPISQFDPVFNTSNSPTLSTLNIFKRQKIVGQSSPSPNSMSGLSSPGLPINTNTTVATADESMESSNWLPLLLRSTNIYSIPNFFVLNEYRLFPEDLGVCLDFLSNYIVFDNGSNYKMIEDIYAKGRCCGDGGGSINGEFGLISSEFDSKFRDLFPASYRVNLNKFLDSASTPPTTNSTASSIDWDSIGPNVPETIQNNTSSYASDFAFQIPTPMCNVKKLNNDLKVNFTSLKFWKYLNFEPFGARKDFRVILVALSNEYNETLLDGLVESYENLNLGVLTRYSGEDVSNGVMTVNGIDQLVEKLDTITIGEQTPLLVMVINWEESFESLIEIAKLLGHSKLSKSPNLFSKVIPQRDFFTSNGYLRKLSNWNITRVMFSLYDQCPPVSSFTELTEKSTKNLTFNVGNHASSSSSDDLFVHLSYERSIDKNWCAAIWSDQNGHKKQLKSWYCGPENGRTFEEISNDIWNVTSSMCEGHVGKKFLVLTRLNNIIPDDELIQWKRLSTSNKEISLIVLAVNSNSKLSLVNEDEISIDLDTPNNQTPSIMEEDWEIVDIKDIVYGMILSTPLPLSNSPTRLSMKTGYLFRESNKGSLVFEVNLLSCSNYWNSNELLRILLKHYRNLCNLNIVCGVSDEEDVLCPWHIMGVKKLLNSLVHVSVVGG